MSMPKRRTDGLSILLLEELFHGSMVPFVFLGFSASFAHFLSQGEREAGKDRQRRGQHPDLEEEEEEKKKRGRGRLFFFCWVPLLLVEGDVAF